MSGDNISQGLLMIQLNDISLQLGTKLLLDHANLTIHRQQKVGLIGANGAGKTSLFRLLLGEYHCDGGELSLPAAKEVAHLKQEMPDCDLPALDYVLQGFQELFELKQELNQAEQANDGMAISHIHARMLEIDAYRAESEAAKILIGLGFSQDQINSPVNSFSGGWRMRLNLGQVLLSQANYLLLDEPTNHLDLEAIVWLESWLEKSPQTIVLISHDREFLDNVTTHIAHLEHQKLTLYTGNYDQFETEYALKLEQQQAQFQKQQTKIAHYQKFIDKFRAKASKAKQAQSRMKMLERMDKVAAVQSENPFHFEFKHAVPAGYPMLKLENVNVGYDGDVIIESINWTISDGDRIAVLGPNGAGKSTFIKALVGKTILAGNREVSKKLNIGYFAQHQLEQLSLNETPMWHLFQVDSTLNEAKARQYLGQYNFKNDMVFEPIARFSGGEKARLALALLIYTAPNLLLLDEPTNHLDMEMRDAIASALQNYDGAMVLISHDRHLLKMLVDDLMVIANKKLTHYDGDLDSYQNWVLTQFAEAQRAKPHKKNKQIKTKPSAPNNQQAIKKLEGKLEKLLTQLNETEAKLTDERLYSDPEFADNLKNLNNTHRMLKQEIEALEESILDLM